MTRYELQKEIFKMTMKLYPTYQHEEVFKHLQRLWKRETPAIQKYHKIMKGITQCF